MTTGEPSGHRGHSCKPRGARVNCRQGVRLPQGAAESSLLLRRNWHWRRLRGWGGCARRGYWRESRRRLQWGFLGVVAVQLVAEEAYDSPQCACPAVCCMRNTGSS